MLSLTNRRAYSMKTQTSVPHLWFSPVWQYLAPIAYSHTFASSNYRKNVKPRYAIESKMIDNEDSNTDECVMSQAQGES